MLRSVVPGIILGLAAASCSEGGGSRGPDLDAANFGGVASIATAGGGTIRIDWSPATDDNTESSGIRYRVFVANESGGQDFSQPTLTTAAGATSAIFSRGLQVGTTTYVVVRSVDGSGLEDQNLVELCVTPVASGSVAFVSDAATGMGTLGSSSDPFPTVQAGVEAVEANGGGAVLVDAAPGGSTYVEEVDLTAMVGEIAIFGGFPRFDGMSSNDILESRNRIEFPTTLSGSGATLTDGDVIHNPGGATRVLVDGLAFTGTRVLTPLSGEVTATLGETEVDGVGTAFTTEVSDGDILRFELGETFESVAEVTDDTALLLSDYFRGPSGTGAAAVITVDQLAIGSVDSQILQVSGCLFNDGAGVAHDAGSDVMGAEVRFVGNEVRGFALGCFDIGGEIAMLRLQNNLVTDECQSMLTSQLGSTPDFRPDAAGCAIYITNNLFEHANFPALDDKEGDAAVYLDAAPEDPASGAAITVLIEFNEFRDHDHSAVWIDGLLDTGDDGSLDLVARDNLSNGSDDEALRFGRVGAHAEGDEDEDPFARVEGRFEIRRNVFTNNNDCPVFICQAVSADGRFEVVVEENVFGVTESDTIDIETVSVSTPGVSDRGIVDVRVNQNVAFGGTDEFTVQVHNAHGGETGIQITENTTRGTNNPSIEIDLEGFAAPTNGATSFPDGVVTSIVFNNDLSGEEVINFDDRRDPGVSVPMGVPTAGSSSVGLIYIGHNFARSTGDGSDGAIDAAWSGTNGVSVIERNFALGAGQDSSEAGFEFDPERDATGSIRVMNNVSTLASGGGVDIDAGGPQLQLINNTVAFAGQNEQGGFENDDNFDSNGDLQSYILNGLAAFNGGDDVDFRGGLRPAYTLVRDTVMPAGVGNLGGDPRFATDLFELLELGQSGDPAEFAEIFSLRNNSQAVNAGHPDAIWNDPDGSRNDMGAYGGPNAGPLGTVGAGAEVPFVYLGTAPGVHLYTGAPLVEETESLFFGFTRAVDLNSVAQGIRIENAGSAVAGTFSLVDIGGGRVVEFDPDSSLAPGSSDFVEVSFGRSLRAADGDPLAYPWTERFAVRADTPIAEVEPNDDGTEGFSVNDLTAAQVLTTTTDPVSIEVSGSFDFASEFDVYSIRAGAGQRLQATLLSVRDFEADVAFRLDLYDEFGNRMTEGLRVAFGLDFAEQGDPFVDHTFELAGTYYLLVGLVPTEDMPDYRLQAVLQD